MEYYKEWPQKKEDIIGSKGPYIRPAGLYMLAKNKYYQGKPIMNDHDFDRLESYYKELFPKWPALQHVGEIYKNDWKNYIDWMWSQRHG